MPYEFPYPNEHSARLLDPKTKHIRVGRTDGSGDGNVQGVKVPKTIAIIWYIIKKDSKEVPIAQALRFPVKNWTASGAKKWLKDNKIKYQNFEPATGKEKQSMSAPPLGGAGSENTAPARACIFNDNAEVTFAKDDSGQEKNSFRIIGYSGGIIKDHWYWGNVAFDLSGMRFAKSRTPVLQEHFRDVRIGFSTKQEISDQVIIEGPFLDNDNAQKLKADMLKGFPMEASLLVPPLVIEQIKEGASVKVNGHTLKGPGAVFRQSTIMEVSMCVFGADSNTKSSVYADIDSQNVKFNFLKENNIMADEKEITNVESFAEQYPDFHKEILEIGKAEGLTEGLAKGQKIEHDLFASLQEVCGDDHELLVQCYSEGKTAAETMQLHVKKLEKEKAQLGEKVTELQKKTKLGPVVTEFTDGSTPPGSEKEGQDHEETLKKEFAASEDLQAEFGDVDSYVAFKKADAAGRVRIAHQT